MKYRKYSKIVIILTIIIIMFVFSCKGENEQIKIEQAETEEIAEEQIITEIPEIKRDRWEYTVLDARDTYLRQLLPRMNNLGTEGWELIELSSEFQELIFKRKLQ